MESTARHRCQIFYESGGMELGITTTVMMGDILHALFLGTFQSWLAVAFDVLVRRNVFRAPPSYPRAGVLDFTLEEFKSRLFRWYDEYEREHGDADITRIQELTTAMVRGKKGMAQMYLKAAETKWLCFC